MADFRNIHTRIWTDSWFSELEPDAKLVFIYLFSNPNASICGIYEMPKRNIALDTGLSLDRVSEILDVFSGAGRVRWEKGIVWVLNLQKYNDAGGSPKLQARIAKELVAISDCSLKRQYYMKKQIPYPESQIPYLESQIPYLENGCEKRREEKEIKRDENNSSPSSPNAFAIYEHEIGVLTPIISEKLKAAENDYPAGWLEDALKESSTHNKRSWAYAEGILKHWLVEGRDNHKHSQEPVYNREE
jgi:DnaD/phage-associated family protein